MSSPPSDPLTRVTNAALMLKAVLDAPDLTDYQRMFAQGVVWSRLLDPALEALGPGDITLIRAHLEVAEATAAFKDAGASTAGPEGLAAALERLDAALEHLEPLQPDASAQQAERSREFLEILRADIPAEG